MRAKILNASAGSGKTYQLAYKYVHDVVEQPALYRHILAVTFTNKATEEMKSRILKEIHLLASNQASGYLDSLCRELSLDEATVRRRAREARSQILHDYSHFTVLTIDTFFQRILRAFIKELGIDLNYNVEIETATVLAKSADRLIDRIAEDEPLRRWMIGFVQERINEGRKWDLRDGILSLGSELFKEKNKEALAMARSREELHEVVTRIGRMADTSKEQMQQTAAEAVAAITAAGLSEADFPYKERGFAHYFYAVAEGIIEGPGGRARKAADDEAAWGRAKSPSQGMRPKLQPLLRRLCTLYDESVRIWNTSDLLRENYRSFALLADLYNRVVALCEEQNLMLLSETKHLLAEFIDQNDAPFIYEKVGNRFDRFMIDEFQDTSTKEWENFLPLLRNAMAQAEERENAVLIVGDIKQSIYRWRGGDWQLLHRHAREALDREETEVVDLHHNFRSLPTVVHFNNRVIARVAVSDNERLNADLDEAVARKDMDSATAATLRDTLLGAYRTLEQIPVRKAEPEGYVSVETYDEEPPVVERICELLDRGFRPCDIMILVRGATDGAKVAAELLNFKRENALREDAVLRERYRFDVMTQEALVVGNAPVASFIAAAFRLALNPDDSMHRALYNHYLGRAFDAPLAGDERDFFRAIRLLSPEEAFERIVIRHDLSGDKLQTAYLQAIHEQIIAFTKSKIADIPLWLAWWEECGSSRSLSVEASERAIEITTIHKAKGLEKRAVVIPYCSWPLDPRSGGSITNIVWAEARGEGAEAGRFPVKYKRSMGESGFSADYFRERVFSHVDNINLLYVALTRAKESLHVFAPRRGSNHVGALLLAALRHDGQRASIDDTALLHAGTEDPDRQIERGPFEGGYTQSEQGERFEFGLFAPPAPTRKEAEGGARHEVLELYPTSEAKLRLRLPSQRYFEEEEVVELAPRNFGILMHKAFEQADDEAAIHRAVAAMQEDGTLSAERAAALQAEIDRALSDPTARSWFDGSWREVRNEAEILVPGSNRIRRPDRVMLRDGEAVVVDYKFGRLDAERYRRQLRDYCRLLREMGYTSVEGYLWFVKLGTIEKVE